MSTLQEVVQTLNQHHVDYILIGGWAAIIHRSSRVTSDYDFVETSQAAGSTRNCCRSPKSPVPLVKTVVV